MGHVMTNGGKSVTEAIFQKRLSYGYPFFATGAGLVHFPPFLSPLSQTGKFGNISPRIRMAHFLRLLDSASHIKPAHEPRIHVFF